MAIFRGEVYFVRLGPTVGREIDTKRRPVVVLSINDINSKPLVVTVVPGTSWAAGKRIHANEVRIDPSATNGLSNTTVFQCHQIKALDHSRFDQAPIGMLSSQELEAIEQAVKLCLGLP
jgi:mRNA interferase MazF